MMPRLRPLLLALSVLALRPGAAGAQSAPFVLLILKNGQQVPAAIVRTEGDRVLFRRDASAPEAGIPLDDVRYAQFRTPPDFDTARGHMAHQEFPEAIENFTSVWQEHREYAAIPGNFHTQAHFWLLSAFLESGQYGEIATRARGFNPGLLMPQLQPAGRLLEAWAYIGRNQPQRAVQQANRLLEARDLTLSQQADLWFLRGMARHQMGEAEAALEDFTSVFALGYGEASAAKGQSFSRILELLHSQKRYREFKSFLELFRINFSRGQLPPNLQKLLQELPPLPDEEDEWAGFTKAPDRLVSGAATEDTTEVHGAGQTGPR